MSDVETDKCKADVVANYWASRGYDVKVWTEAAQVKGMFVHCVRTDLVNGLPKGFKGNKTNAHSDS